MLHSVLLVFTDTLIGPGSKHITPPITRQFRYPPLIGRGFTDLYSGIRLIEHLQFIYGPSEGYIVHLQPIGRLYSSSTACQKAVQFTLRTINRTHGQLRALFKRQPKRYLRRDFLRISFIFYGSIFLYFFYILWFYQSKLQRVYTSGFIFQVPPMYNYSTCYTEEFPMYFLYFIVLFLMYFFYTLRSY